MRKLGNLGFFRGAEGAANFFWPLSTRYFGVFFLIFARPIILDGGAARPIISKFGGMPPNRDFLNPSLGSTPSPLPPLQVSYF